LEDAFQMSAAAAPRSAPEVVVPVCIAGVIAIGLAVLVLAQDSATELRGPLLLLAAAVVADRFDLPAIGETSFSLSVVFVLAAAVLYGPAAGAVLGALGITLKFVLFERPHPPVRSVFNISQVALAGGTAGLASSALGGTDNTLPAIVAAAGAHLGVNLALVTVVVARAERLEIMRLFTSSLRWIALPFAMAVSVVPVFVVAWENSQAIAISAILPLAAVALYVRSLAQNRATLELALTDPLTGLGNRRHFEERLRGELDRADTGAGPLSLVLIDLDRFKTVNDRFGHEAGDQLLRAVAACLRQGGEAFRFGGDEFALLLPGRTGRDADEIVQAVRERLAAVVTPDGAPVQAGFGVATYPDLGVPRDELVRSADRALYREKQRVVNVG
jgi:diguanylate cyclase (GGDEF)-like protein